jgi:hypothetical protein
MRPLNQISRALAVSAALALALPGVALAGEKDRAQKAIADAKAKISASAMIGATDAAPSLQARAQASLNSAEALLARGKKTESIVAAQEASQMANQAIAITNGAKTAAANNAVGDARASAAQAQQAAEVSAAAAVAANARADAAVQAPATVTTTVQTEERVAAAAVPPVKAKPRTTTTRVTTRKPAAVVKSTTVTTSTTPQ